MSALSSVFHTQRVTEARRDVEARALDRQVNPADVVEEYESVVGHLRVAAIASFTDLIGDASVDEMMRAAGTLKSDPEASSQECFENWQAYLDALAEADANPTADDLLFFGVAGLLARKGHEVRDALRRPKSTTWLNDSRQNLPNLEWIGRVRSYISLAILYTIRQSNRADIQAAGQMLRELAAFQKEVESRWLNEQQSQKRRALTLLSFYHLAEAVVRTSEFLLTGVVQTEGRAIQDILPELRRLLVRAEEFLSVTGDSEASLWLVAAAAGLMCLREDSIWIQSRGISERIDLLLIELTQLGRPHPVFSLLPSQQEAIREAFLDRSKLAIVLQMPTSSGKTLLAEFAIAQTFDAYREQTRVVYVVPTRALATQIRRTLAEDLGPLQIEVSAAGSAFEEDPYELRLLSDADGVVVATPEKLDLLLRNHPDWFRALRLIVVDEAHLLNDGERGARLELLLANLRREQADARLLLLTPFMDNAAQIASWLSRERGLSINVQWRPSRVLVGLATLLGERGAWKFRLDWRDPYSNSGAPKPLFIDIGSTKTSVGTNADRVLFLGRKLQPLGTILAMFSASPADAETTAIRFADPLPPLPVDSQTPQLRLAIALARHEFGDDSGLATALERGVAYHHSSLSPTLRYLIEDQVRAEKIRFIAATSTLAQGMNFPVATIIVHSVHKPYGHGNFSGSEFWNIAGRAGRVGMVEQGLVVFADSNHRQHLDRYVHNLHNVLTSALLAILPNLRPEASIKEQYRNFPALRPFIQYLAHAAATSDPARAIANLEELIQQSLANHQVQSPVDSRKLRTIARAYLQQLTTRSGGLLKAADQTGLGTFSFDELYAKVRDDPILKAGPKVVLESGVDGFTNLIEVLRWLPELNLALGFGAGQMNVKAVAHVVEGWIAGREVHELANLFPGDDAATQSRNAAKYLYGTVSQSISWGTHAYVRGWLATGEAHDLPPEEKMLPAYLQYGVRTPEAAVASLLGVPRPFAEAMGEMYRENTGALTPDTAQQFRVYVESVDQNAWQEVVNRAGVRGVRSSDIFTVFRQMQGLPAR